MQEKEVRISIYALTPYPRMRKGSFLDSSEYILIFNSLNNALLKLPLKSGFGLKK